MRHLDAIVVGSGPNGLAAAIVLARAGLATRVIERGSTPGGGARSEELTLPGFVHDVCSAVHPLAFASPFFARLPLERHGLVRVDSPAPLAHVLAPGDAVTLERSVDVTARGLGPDEEAYRELFEPFVDEFDALSPMILGPLRWPRHPTLMSRFGLVALRSARSLVESTFRTPGAGGLFAGMAAHAMLPLEKAATASFGMVLGIAGHAVGWPIARGGSQSIVRALVGVLRELGGELELGHEVRRLRDLVPARVYVMDVTPRQLLAMTDDELPPPYRRRLARYRYGPGVFKVDWALREPVPWLNAACRRAATVHIGGDFDAVARATSAPHQRRETAEPFVLFVQPSLFDGTRAPGRFHTAWAYCHVPSGDTTNRASLIEAAVERHAPGFRDVILARAVRNAREMEAYNPNYVGGDINGGSASLPQLFTRPLARFNPYATDAPNVYFCSSSTPPGGGVHGMCGYFAAKSVLETMFRRKLPADIDITCPRS